MKTIRAHLSKREIQVYELIAAGLTNKQIADQLIISYSTVKNHVSKILSALGMQNRIEIVAFYHSGGVIEKFPCSDKRSEDRLQDVLDALEKALNMSQEGNEWAVSHFGSKSRFGQNLEITKALKTYLANERENFNEG